MTYGNVSLGAVEIHKQNNHKAFIRACGLTTGSTGPVLITFHLPKVNTLHSIFAHYAVDLRQKPERRGPL